MLHDTVTPRQRNQTAEFVGLYSGHEWEEVFHVVF
jgi:hypothetical protein